MPLTYLIKTSHMSNVTSDSDIVDSYIIALLLVTDNLDSVSVLFHLSCKYT